MKVSSLPKPLQLLLYRLVVAFRPRKNKTYTQFHRFLNQYDVLTGRVLPYLNEEHDSASRPPLEIIIFGCSSGAKPYSLSSVLQHRVPVLKFRIRAFDIVPEVIAKAQLREYKRNVVYNCPFITGEFVQRTFTITADGLYRVKDEIAARVTFAVGNILDSGLFAILGKADLYFTQNMLSHLKTKLVQAGSENLITLFVRTPRPFLATSTLRPYPTT